MVHCYLKFPHTLTILGLYQKVCELFVVGFDYHDRSCINIAGNILAKQTCSMVSRMVPVVIFDLIDRSREGKQDGKHHVLEFALRDSTKLAELALAYDRQHWMSVNVPQRDVQHSGDSCVNAKLLILDKGVMVGEGGDNRVGIAMPDQVKETDGITGLFQDTAIGA